MFSLRSERFRLVSEQNKIVEWEFRLWPREKWNVNEKMKESKNSLKIQEYPSVDNFEGKKRLHGAWKAWFIVKWVNVADFLYIRSCLPLPDKINEAALSLFCELGTSLQDQFCLQIEVSLWRKKRKANIFENCTCQQVDKAKNTADRQHSPRSWPLLTTFARSAKKTFSFTVSLRKQIKLYVSSQKE